MSKGLKIFFTCSIVLNLLLLGAGGGIAIKKWYNDPWHKAQSQLSPQSQAMMTQRFSKMHEDLDPLFAEISKSREELKAVLGQDKFDSQKFDKVAIRIRGLRQKMGDKMIASTKELVAILPAQDRRKMADQLVSGFGWKRGGRSSSWRCFREHFGPMQKPVAPHRADPPT